MRLAPVREIVLSVMEASKAHSERKPFFRARPPEKFVDTSTWEQIIFVLEQSEESDRSAWFLAETASRNCDAMI